MTYREILSNERNNHLPADVQPLWKLDVTTKEYDALKDTIWKAFMEECQFRVTKEVALYYANWWRKEYAGGTPSKERIASDLSKDISSTELYDCAKKGLRELRISPIRRNGRKFRFRTLLLQGGLPIKSMEEGNNKANYCAFLEGLIKYTNEVGIDYDNIHLIDSLPCKNRLPPTFRTDEIYELSLQIVDDLRENGENGDYGNLLAKLFDKETISKFNKAIIEEKEKKMSKKDLFSIEWQVRKNNDLKLFYIIPVPQQINSKYLPETMRNEYGFSVFINNREVAKYIRTLADANGDVCFIKHSGQNEISKEWQPDTDIIIRLSNNGLFHEINHPAPDFSEPVLLSGADGIWNIKKTRQENDKNAILLLEDSEWKYSNNPVPVKYYEQDAFWIESENGIELQNETTGEAATFDNSPFLYRYEVVGNIPLNVKSKTRKLINANSTFSIYYNIDDEIINNGFKIYYRRKSTQQWDEYTRQTLPLGLLFFKFKYPDGKEEYAKFFNIGNLSVRYLGQTADTGIVSFVNWNQPIVPLSQQKGIKSVKRLSDNRWNCVRDADNRYYANDISFRISVEENGMADILVSAPFKGVVITDITGNIVGNRSTLAIHSLWQYKCLVIGEERTSITIWHNTNPQNKRTFKFNLEKSHEIPLSSVGEHIQSLFTLHGTDHEDFDSFVQLKIGDKITVFIKQFKQFDILLKFDEGKVTLTDSNGQELPSNTVESLYALKVECEYPDEIEVLEFTKREDGFYLPELPEDETLNGFIVFSNDNSAHRLRPTYHNHAISSVHISFQERLDQIRITLSDARFIDYEWDKIAVYFRLTVENNLPLKTIDSFDIISESPLLMVKLALILLHNKTPYEILKKGLLMFENEFALAWHWIDNDVWEKGLEWFRGKYDNIAEDYIRNILENSLNIHGEQLNEIRELILNSKKEDADTNINEPDYINKYLNIVGNNLDETLLRNDHGWIIYPRIEQEWQNLLSIEYGAAIRVFLWGPVKAALSAMGRDNVLWKSDRETERRIMFYYWKLNPEEYNKMFIAMLKKINYRLNHNELH